MVRARRNRQSRGMNSQTLLRGERNCLLKVLRDTLSFPRYLPDNSDYYSSAPPLSEVAAENQRNVYLIGQLIQPRSSADQTRYVTARGRLLSQEASHTGGWRSSTGFASLRSNLPEPGKSDCKCKKFYTILSKEARSCSYVFSTTFVPISRHAALSKGLRFGPRK